MIGRLGARGGRVSVATPVRKRSAAPCASCVSSQPSSCRVSRPLDTMANRMPEGTLQVTSASYPPQTRRGEGTDDLIVPAPANGARARFRARGGSSRRPRSLRSPRQPGKPETERAYRNRSRLQLGPVGRRGQRDRVLGLQIAGTPLVQTNGRDSRGAEQTNQGARDVRREHGAHVARNIRSYTGKVSHFVQCLTNARDAGGAIFGE